MKAPLLYIDNHLATRKFDSSASHTVSTFTPCGYQEGLKKQHQLTFEIFSLFRMHPEKNQQAPREKSPIPQGQNFANIGDHSIAVAFAAETIARALHKAGHLSKRQVDYVVERALLHDILKPLELIYREEIGHYRTTADVEEFLRQILLKSGLPLQYINYLLTSGSETGHESIQRYLYAKEHELAGINSGMLVEKIIFVADAMTASSVPHNGEVTVTRFLSPWNRLVACEFDRRYPWLFTEGLGIADNDQIVVVKDILHPPADVQVCGSFAALQLYVSRELCVELRRLLAPRSTNFAEDYILSLLCEASAQETRGLQLSA